MNEIDLMSIQCTGHRVVIYLYSQPKVGLGPTTESIENVCRLVAMATIKNSGTSSPSKSSVTMHKDPMTGTLNINLKIEVKKDRKIGPF